MKTSQEAEECLGDPQVHTEEDVLADRVVGLDGVLAHLILLCRVGSLEGECLGGCSVGSLDFAEGV